MFWFWPNFNSISLLDLCLITTRGRVEVTPRSPIVGVKKYPLITDPRGVYYINWTVSASVKISIGNFTDTVTAPDLQGKMLPVIWFYTHNYSSFETDPIRLVKIGNLSFHDSMDMIQSGSKEMTTVRGLGSGVSWFEWIAQNLENLAEFSGSVVIILIIFALFFCIVSLIIWRCCCNATPFVKNWCTLPQ